MRRILRITILAGLPAFSVVAQAATPASGTMTPAQTSANPLTYTAGPFAMEVNPFSVPFDFCLTPYNPFAPCDEFALNVSVPAGYLLANPAKANVARIEWASPAADFDLSVYAVEPSGARGALIKRSAQTGTTSESVEWPLAEGDNRYVIGVAIRVGANESFTGKLWIGDGLAPVVAPPTAAGIAPRFQEYNPVEADGSISARLGAFAGEPTITTNPRTGSVFVQGVYEVSRLTFEDRTSPAHVTWEPVDPPTGISNKNVTVDPILLGDPDTGRIWAMQLSGGQSVTDYSDDDGETWLPTISGGWASGADHQGMGVGPYPAASFIQHPLYENALYYCSQHVAASFCSRSDDGGVSWGPIVPIYNAVTDKCVGLHGHPKVAPDGTVYVPNKGCELDTPVIGTGFINVIVSEDAGITWNIRKIPDSVGGLTDKGDPSVAIDKAGTLYVAYTNLSDGHMRVAMSDDRGATFTPSVDLSKLAGIEHTVFPAMVAGDAGRAAVAFIGTPYAGEGDTASLLFKGRWYLYIATTYDSGATWFVENVTGTDPVQGPGGIGNGGNNRNHYDFFDAEIDREGRVVVVHVDGCHGSCSNETGPHGFQKLLKVQRQSGGRRMYAQFDPVEPARPAAPLLGGYRDALGVQLQWPAPDHGGTPVTGYRIFRSVDGGPETMLSFGASQREWRDRAALDAGKTYRYRLVAVNALGEGASSDAFAPAPGHNAPQPQLSCALPGQSWADRSMNDPSGVSEGGALPPFDITGFAVAEPEDMPGKIVFTIANALPTPEQAGQLAQVFFDHAGSNRIYRLQYSGAGDNEVASYKDNDLDTDNPQDVLYDFQRWTPVGTLDEGSGVQGDGSVRFVLDKALLGIETGDRLLAIWVRQDATGGPSGILMADYAGGRQEYRVVGNDYCQRAASNRSPLAAFTATTGETLAVAFDAAGSSDPDSGDDVASYAFDFGDGTSDVSGSPSVVHPYAQSGTYTVRLVVRDSFGAASAVAQQVVTVGQNAVTPFTFVHRTGVATNVFVTSEGITLAGFSGSLPVGVAGGSSAQYSLNGGAYTSTPGSAVPGTLLRVRHISASAAGVETVTTVSVGDYDTDFKSTTSSIDRTPEPFTFGTKTGVVGGSLVESDSITLRDYNAPLAIVPGPGLEYDIGAGWTSASGTLAIGQAIKVRHTATMTPLGYTKTSVKIGGVTGYFTTRTK